MLPMHRSSFCFFMFVWSSELVLTSATTSTFPESITVLFILQEICFRAKNGDKVKSLQKLGLDAWHRSEPNRGVLFPCFKQYALILLADVAERECCSSAWHCVKWKSASQSLWNSNKKVMGLLKSKVQIFWKWLLWKGYEQFLAALWMASFWRNKVLM